MSKSPSASATCILLNKVNEGLDSNVITEEVTDSLYHLVVNFVL